MLVAFFGFLMHFYFIVNLKILPLLKEKLISQYQTIIEEGTYSNLKPNSEIVLTQISLLSKSFQD